MICNRFPCCKAPDRTYGQNAGEHDPSAFQINILVLDVDGCGDRRAENIGRKRKRGCLICTGFTCKRRAERKEDHTMTVAADSPARPVPTPAPTAAIASHRYSMFMHPILLYSIPS